MWRQPRLRAVVDKALGANMTRDTIDCAIARGAGTAESENLEELVYEGYGPGGVAILCETLTDNKNRTVAEVSMVSANLAEASGRAVRLPICLNVPGCSALLPALMRK